MAPPSVGHFVFLTYMAWGHLRPESALAVTIARKFPQLTITFIVHVDYVSTSRAEMQRQCTDKERDGILSRIRMIGLGKPLNGPAPIHVLHGRLLEPGNMIDKFPAFLATVMKDEGYVDDSGVSWAPVGRAPRALVTDVTLGAAIEPILGKHDLAILVYWFGSASAFTRFFAPRALGGQAEYEAEVKAVFDDPVERGDRTFDDVARDTWIRSPGVPGDVVRVKGLSPFYQWEDFPQSLWIPVVSYLIFTTPIRLVKAAQGVLLPTTAALEPEGLEGIEEFFSSNGQRQILAVGPQLPRELLSTSEHSAIQSVAIAEVNDPNGQTDGVVSKEPCLVFLDKALSTHGKQSVLYIAFGTLIFPLVPRHIQILVEALLELDPPMPFVFSTSTAAAHASLPVELLEKVETSGKGLVVQWAPQQAILTHPALGWVFTHGGGNTVFEALSQGLPMIVWPFFIDQPMHAHWLSQDLDVAFDLLQVRTGAGTQKAYRGGPNGTEILGTEAAVRAEMDDVLQKCKGGDGKRKRRNAERARGLIVDALRPGGQVDQHLERLSVYMS